MTLSERTLAPVFGLGLFCVALWTLHQELAEYHYRDIVQQLQSISVWQLLLAVGVTVVSYIALIGYDVLAVRYVKQRLSYPNTALVSFIAYALGHNIGLAALTGGAIRYRFYSAWGFSTADIAQVVAFGGLSFWLGFFSLGSLAFLVEPLAIPATLHFPLASVRPLGGGLLVLVVDYLGLNLLRTPSPLTLRSWQFAVPPPQLAAAQVAVSTLDWALTASVLYVLLPPTPGLSYLSVVSIFLLAQMAGFISQVPGGLGVFETVVLLLLSPVLPATSVLGALLAYRAIYYLLPLLLATSLLAAHEIAIRKEKLAWLSEAVDDWLPAVVPRILAVTTFLGGVVLLVSGTTPAVPSRLAWLHNFLPLPFIELSHFLSSLIGMALLILARGLQQKLDVAYHLTAVLLGAGSLLSLLKGFDYEEALVLAVLLGTLIPCRRHFLRRASLLSEPLSREWVTAIGIVWLGCVWLGLFAYKHVEYGPELWWQFTLDGHAPRFLRAGVGVASVALSVALSRLLRPARVIPAVPTPDELQQVQLVVAHAHTTAANLALLDDKSLLFSPSQEAFIMYGVEGRSWVALGDPVGQAEEREELVWQFRELSYRQAGWPVFYEVGTAHLPLYLNLGLTFLKLGEEARVPLDSFSLEGRARKELRHVVRHVEREGCTFEVLPATAVSAVLSELQAISDGWLAEHRTREKGFSLGFFQPEYIRRFPVGLVRRNGQIVAFANLWCGAEHHELSVDLMRYVPHAPHGVMDYLFIQLLLWGRQEGYGWFNLGMAPLSGLDDRALAPAWNRLGAFMFRHGEHFYNFRNYPG